MPSYFSGHWDNDGCNKHNLPQTPCPQCLATADPDLMVTLTEMDRNALDWDPELSARNLFPVGKSGDKLFAMAR